MRALLLAGAAALAVCAAAPNAARAQFIVQDPVNLIQNTITATTSVKTLAEAVAAVQQLRRTYALLDQTYNAIAHTTDLQGAARLLGGVSRWALPPGSEIPGLLTALGDGQWGRAAELAAGGQVYRTPEPDEYQREMDRRERVTANVQAIALAMSEDTEARAAGLEALQARLEAARDGTEVTAVNGLIAVERQNLEAHRASLESARVMLAADDRVSAQRREQMWRRDLDEHLDRTRAALGGW